MTAYSVGKAHDLSIETVYQDKSLGEKQPLWRNFFVGRQITNRFGFINVKKEKEIASQILLNTIGFRGVGLTVDSTVQTLSGGERQGISIGRAMHFNSDLIILDEPTAALDVSVQAVVLNLLQDLKDSLGMSYLFVSHDLNVVRLLCDRVIVMQAGRIVEQGPTEQVLFAPQAQYTRDLLAAIPTPNLQRRM